MLIKTTVIKTSWLVWKFWQLQLGIHLQVGLYKITEYFPQRNSTIWRNLREILSLIITSMALVPVFWLHTKQKKLTRKQANLNTYMTHFTLGQRILGHCAMYFWDKYIWGQLFSLPYNISRKAKNFFFGPNVSFMIDLA